MVEKLQVKLLGGFEASLESGDRIALKGRKPRALLALLAISPGTAVSREKLTSLLWSDRGDEQARGSLRQALAELRRALGDNDGARLKADRDNLTLDPESTVCDAVELEELAVGEGRGGLERAAELYRGDLLDGIGIGDPGFEDWVTVERARFRELAQDGLRRLLENQTRREALADAVQTARKLLSLDPLQEPVHRTLMQLYDRLGDRAMALKQYQSCRDVLRAELGVEPEAETEKLHEAIRAGAESAPSATPAAIKVVEPVSEKPSIAVLPFANMSGDPEQEYFADGITQDIITELGRDRSLFVIARNSVFTYKGKAVDVREVGRQLGVQYVVEGSVRRAADRVRVNAELSEAKDGKHVWAERYDRKVEDVFAVQDEICSTIVGTLTGRLEMAGHDRALRLSEKDLAGYDLYLKGRAYWQRFNPADNAKAHDCLLRAAELYPTNAQIQESLAVVHFMNWLGYWVEPRDAEMDLAYDYAYRAVQLDENDSRSQMRLGEILWFQGRHLEARSKFDRALQLNPNDAESIAVYALYLCALGEHEESLKQFEIAARLNPFDPGWRLWFHGVGYYSARRYDEAIALLVDVHESANEINGWLAASFAQVGRVEEARRYLDKFLENARKEFVHYPGDRLGDWEPYWDGTMRYKNREDLDHLLDGLRKAGLED